MPQGGLLPAQSFPRVYPPTAGEFLPSGEGHAVDDGADARARRASSRFHPARASLASRMSHSIATRLSIVGLRETPRSGTVVGVTINTLCNVMGAGVLALPLAMRNSSVGLGLMLLAYLATMSAYAVYCLVAACDATGRYSVTEVTAFSLFPSRSFETFCAQKQEGLLLGSPTTPSVSTSQFRFWKLQHARDELYRRRWRRAVTILVETIVFCNNFGSLIIYARVIADSMPPVVANIYHELDAKPPALLTDQAAWLVASGVIFFLLSCAKNMEELKWTSLLGFLTIFYVVVIVLYRFHTASWSADPEENARGFPSIDPNARGRIDWLSFPVSALRTVSAYGMAFGYHFNVPYFYSELRHRVPREMMKSVGLAFPIIVASYAVSGVFGYLTFGELVASAKAGGNIILNYPAHDRLVNLGRLGLFAHFACVFPIVSICARRGVHRLTMMALTWSEQSALMRLEVEELEEEVESREQQHADGQDAATSEQTETTPLLPHDQRATSGVGETGSASVTDTLNSPLAFPQPSALDPAELDRDVGSPDDTTRLAIVLEALLLVSASVLLAGAVSGIGFVIDIVGSLFGVFLILIVPGIVGMCIFSTDFLMSVQATAPGSDGTGGGGGVSSAAAGVSGSIVAPAEPGSEGRHGSVTGVRYARVKYWLCALSAVTGVVFTVVATTIVVLDHLLVKGKKGKKA